jgi:acyl carrier protein
VVTGRQKEIIFVNGQNYYPHDLEEMVQRHTRIETGKIAFAPIKKDSHSQTEWVGAFVVHKGAMNSFVEVHHEVRRVINEQLGIDVQVIVPIRQMPKTTSGKIQRLKLANEYSEGQYTEVIDELHELLQAQLQTGSDSVSTDTVEQELLSICKELISDQQISTNDNLFEIGTNSLTLAQIHERIDERYPGQLDITDFFDYPTIAELSGYLNTKLAQA